MKRRSVYSVVVPVYQGSDALRQLTQELHEVFTLAQLRYEVIFVYDCGPGYGWEIISQIRQQFGDQIKAVRLSRNFGQHNAIICGFKYAIGDFIITMDDDLQHLPSDILKLIAQQEIGDFDVVYGKYKEVSHSFFRNLTSVLMKKMLRIGIPDLHPDYSAFRILKREVALYCLEMNNSYTFLDGYLMWITNNISSVFVDHQKRQIGKSSYSLRKLLNHSINIFITFSDLPVRFLSVTSILVFLLTFCYSVYIVVRKLLFNDLLTGFPTLIIAVGFGVGLLMLGMGILGEYMHRISLKTTQRPNFVEREVLQ